MIIGGLKKISLIDYPSEISSVIFTRGCNMRCIYCHNTHLVLPEFYSPEIPQENLFTFLESRKDRLTAAVISGGEPTIHRDLPEFIKKIKDLGLKIKLDTNGTNPWMIQKLIETDSVDYIAMDVKSVPEKYNSICGIAVDLKAIYESIELIRKSRIKKEFRLTVLNGYHSENDIKQIRNITGGMLTLQNFHYAKTILNDNLDFSQEFNAKDFAALNEIE